MKCEIVTATWREACGREAVGTWQFGTSDKPFGSPLFVCKLHANKLTKQGHWDVSVAFELKEAAK